MKTLIIILLSLSLCACSTPFFKTYIYDSEAANTPEGRAATIALGQALMQQGSDIQWRNQAANDNAQFYHLYHMMLLNQR